MNEELEKHYKAWAIANGYVKLAKDQTPPAFSFSEEPPNMRFGYQEAQKDMDNAGWRRVEL